MHHRWARPSKKYLLQFTLNGVIYFSGIKTNLHVASFVSLLQKPEFTASAVLDFNEVLEQRSAKLGLRAISSPPAVFVNMVVFDRATLAHLDVIYDSFHAMTTGLKRCDRKCMAHRAENVYYLALYREICCMLS